MSKANLGKALAGAASVLLVAGASAPGAAAAGRTEDSGSVQATVRKTVLQTGSAVGELASNRMYTQVSAIGNGSKTVTVPVGTTSNRNLNQFGSFPMDGESIVFDLNVDGSVEQRTLTEVDIQPVVVSVKVMLDGKEIQPSDLVGADGVVDVEYTVTNTTTHSQEVTFQDAAGKDVKQTIEVADPFVGSLDVTLPQGFNEVTAPGATVAGNGQNETKIGYTFVLFPPLGQPVVTVGYQARVSNGQMPAAEFAFLPIQPFDNSTISGTYEAYQGGAQTGATIFGAGQQIGDNLLKLQDGAGQLLVGLSQLQAGAEQLNDGLANTAAPGSAKLADGASQLADGLNNVAAPGSAKLADGADQLSAGLNELNSKVPELDDGVGQLNDGAQQLNDGAQSLSSGLNGQILPGAKQLAGGNTELAAGMAKLQAGIDTLSKGVATLPASIQQNDGYKQLQAALKGVQDAIDQKFVPGINQLEQGLDNTDPADPGFKQVLNALYQKLYNTDPAAPGALQALQSVTHALGDTDPTATLTAGGVLRIVKTLKNLLGCVALDPPPAQGITGTCTKVPADVVPGLPPGFTANFYTYSLLSGIQEIVGDANVSPTVLYALSEIIDQIGDGSPPASAADEPTATYAIKRLIAGIGSKSDFPPANPANPPETLLYGLEAMKAGLTNPHCKATDPQNPANPCGVKEIQGLVAGGINQLVEGISAELIKGIGSTPMNPATCSPTTLTCASAQLTAGATQLATGASTLASGIGTAAAGSSQLASGSKQLADGTKKLNASVPTLADGVAQLNDGGEQLADGANKLADGLGTAADGSQQVADGANQLADGLGAAADGSGKIADGLGQATPGAGKIEDGAGQLKEQGADELAKSGKEAQAQYAQNVAILQAQQALGEAGSGIPFGNATGTDTVTTAAYQLQLAGIAAHTENNAVKYGLAIALIAGAAGAAYAARRKLTA